MTNDNKKKSILYCYYSYNEYDIFIKYHNVRLKIQNYNCILQQLFRVYFKYNL
jgi:hypothetical protein